ncbi:MAG: hypothetical protein P8L31_12685 [Pseudomonadales bacterium]|jgi:hypothetical protein|nr:hypothetical protein [Pseudomonadales bacterium]
MTTQATQEGTREILLAQATSPELSDALVKAYEINGNLMPGMAPLIVDYGFSHQEAYRVCCRWVVLFRKYEADSDLPMSSKDKRHTLSFIAMLKDRPPAVWWEDAKPWFTQEFIKLIEFGLQRRGARS